MPSSLARRANLFTRLDLFRPAVYNPFLHGCRDCAVAPEQSTLGCKDCNLPCRIAATLLILGAAALRIVYLACDCPLDLSPDEAHYWQWSQHLDWCYYSKGPLVAWLIHLSCLLSGDWSVQMIGSPMLAVRLPAVACGSLLLASLYILTVQCYQSDQLALAVVAVALTVPAVSAGSLLMTIDAPFTCLWGWALVLGHRAVFGGSRWAWPALGLVVGLGILAKYTMLLWAASFLLFLIAVPSYRRLMLHPGFWCFALLAALCCLPILVWNFQHDWVGLWHVKTLAGVRSGAPTLTWTGPLLYLAAQFGVLLGFWFIAWARALWAARPWRDTHAAEQYLWWMSAPTFALFFCFSPVTGGGEANWPVAAYLSGLVLTAGWLVREWQFATGRRALLVRGSIAAACGLGLGITLLLYQAHHFTTTLTEFVSAPNREEPAPLRRIDPTCRLRGWKTLAAAVDEQVSQLRAAGMEPVVVCGNWLLPGELAFYCKQQTEIHSIGLALGCRHSQHDFWRPNPVFDPALFLGRTFIFVGDPRPLHPLKGFDAVEPTKQLVHFEEGVPIAVWQITICHGFRGFHGDLVGHNEY